ncbi:MAG: MFS transporter [Candidatus Andeanibacterium colombiense]|uniref:MFS transporter n=1 Tax=Candidatus Andeanibacterium colombiense TaxID=3121345 RepID=A0AAJ5X4Z3_9SPHN|nr:MAG: MFS transporter [Sphingomonadaceae bacterium]
MLHDANPIPETSEGGGPREVQSRAGKSKVQIGLSVAILAAGIAGNADIALSPLLLSGMAQFLHFNDRVLGELASISSIGSSLATVAALFVMHRKGWPLRLTAIVCLCAYAVINLAIPSFFDNPMLLLAAIFLGGCCSGLLWAVAVTAQATVHGNERLIAIFYGTPYLTGLVFQPMMPFVFARWGLPAPYFGIAGACVLSLLLVRFFPARAVEAAAPEREEGTAGGARRGSFIGIGIVLLALFVQYCANSGIWVYFDRIGRLAGHTPQASANAVALGVGMALVGTMLATVLTVRLRPLPTILIISAVMALATLGLLEAGNYVLFAGSISLFNVMITFITPFFFILLNRISTARGRVALAANICMMGGFALGPALVGRIVEGGDFSSAIIVTAVAFLVSAVLVVASSGSGRLRS